MKGTTGLFLLALRRLPEGLGDVVQWVKSLVPMCDTLT